MGDIEDLRSILGAEPYRGTPVDWDAADRALGVTIPSDFRELVNAIGPGKIGNNLILLRPFSSNRNYDQLIGHRQRMEDLEMIWEDEAELVPDELTKPEIFNEPGIRPILWARSGLGFYLYWVARDDAEPSTWQIAVEPARSGTWEFLPGTATNLLLRLLRGEVSSRYQHGLEQTDEHYFTPAERSKSDR